MVEEIALVTLKKPVVLPGLSHRTGKPCRTVNTRQIVVRREGYQLAVEGCLDLRGAPHRTALRIIMRVQRGLVQHAESLSPSHEIVASLASLPIGIDMSMANVPSAYYSLASFDAVELIGGWADTQGNVTVQMRPVCGFLAPRVDPVIAPWRQLGHLWPNGQFARPGGSEIVSFVRNAGVILAGLLPAAVVCETEERFTCAWGTGWRPERISESALSFASKIADQYRQRKFVDFTPDLVREAAKNIPVRPFGAAWDSRCKPTAPRQTWRNGYSRAGKLVAAEDWTVAQFFIRTEAPGAPRVSENVVER
ncbi:MAG: hypothetical protein Q8O35_03300 [Humidesulfovibrio sp.]|uniref:hypothetical protein n=1 Tax=Humidesulfovibrio sp. TaxID=2910988 RepID=UPI00273249D0|nr:hypothetical protein [Humidesulfovibrio sp.]MDP2847204.1 hypothetical protein [Humidesulfovibrio sp.]